MSKATGPAPVRATLAAAPFAPMPEEIVNIQVTVAEAIEQEVMLALNRAGGVITDVRRESEHSTSGQLCRKGALPPSGLGSRSSPKGRVAFRGASHETSS
jgi:hypothetical protein